ncbi:hypothetical protein BDV33DRAFT_209849 [Aspergillus novoparasiticus]|uniref:WD40-repeat-containing domain protein n=1 Tax=Aspergillus novoparasiticus TaxID=986946 RepID=A0A5N6EAL1_9EURO|nr:hypothetical protein BDV33DRAFT_209849 [Aspergillus novoparasiticus]
MFSPDGRLLAAGSASYDQTIRIWNTATWDLVHAFENYTRSTGEFSPDGRLIAFVTCDSTTHVRDHTTGALYRTLTGYDRSPKLVAFSPNGELLASASVENPQEPHPEFHTIRIWNSLTGVLLHICELQGMRRNLKFSPNGSCITFHEGLLMFKHILKRALVSGPVIHLGRISDIMERVKGRH